MRKTITMLLLLVLAAGFSCTREPSVSPLRIGTNVWPGYEPIWLASRMNYFDGDIRPVACLSSTVTLSAFQNRELDAAALTLDEALTLAQFDADFLIILVADVSNGSDVLLGKPALRNLKDIKGRRIGVETTAVGGYMLMRILERANLHYADVGIVNLNVNEHEAAFKKGAVDAVITFEPVRTKLLATGARLLFDSSRIPDEIFDVIVVRRRYLEEHPEIVSRFIKGWFRALAYLREHPAAAAERMRSRLNLNADEILVSFRGLHLPDEEENQRLLLGEHPALLTAAKSIQAVMLRQHLLFKKTDAALLLKADAVKPLYR